MKQMIRFSIAIFFTLAFFACNQSSMTEQGASTEETEASKPNIIYILADDLGYGDLSCYGQIKFSTPNIDKIAKNGIKFTRHYAGNTVCAPSRSSLMTGLHTGHTPIRGNTKAPGSKWGNFPLPDSSLTVAEILKANGYTNGAFGKWGMGPVASEGNPMKQGFDAFYGFNSQSLAHRYYPTFLWHNNDSIHLGNQESLNVYVHDSIHAHALQFIDDNKDNPFFLFLPYTIPHAELVVPEDSIFEKYDGKFEETPHEGDDYFIEGYKPNGYCSQEKPRATFAAMMNRLDNYVGDVLNKIEELGLGENTIIMFTSDNGPHLEGGADPDFFNSNGDLRGYKRDLYEGGVRVPFVAQWPGKIKAGTASDHISAFWDFLPTALEIAEIQHTEPIDGISFLPSLVGESQTQKHDYLYWEFYEQGGKQGVVFGDWKVIRLKAQEYPEGDSVVVFDLANDIGEENNVADKQEEILAQGLKYINEAHIENNQFKFNYEK